LRDVDTDNIKIDSVNIWCYSLVMMKETIVSTKEAAAYHHGDLRRALIAAALELAAEGKDWNFSLREVARRAGVSHNAPYNHFAHKRELLDAAATAGHDLLRTEVLAAIAGITDPYEALMKMGVEYIGFGTKNPALYRLMFDAVLSGPEWRPEEVLEAGHATSLLLEDLISQGASSGIFAPELTQQTELEIAALHAWATVHGLTMFAIDGLATVEGVSFERIVQRVLTTLLQGIKTGNGT